MQKVSSVSDNRDNLDMKNIWLSRFFYSSSKNIIEIIANEIPIILKGVSVSLKYNQLTNDRVTIGK